MRIAPAIDLDSAARTELETLVRRRTTPVRVAERCRIVLLAAQGLQDKQIAERIHVAPRMAALWRSRFPGTRRGASEGCAALRPASRLSQHKRSHKWLPGPRKANLPAATHWSRSTMARTVGISDSSVGRIWRAHGLKPHRIESFKISNDPNFAEKLDDIVGLYLNPPERTRWSCRSMKRARQIQALDRTQPGLPMKKKAAARP